jgi:cell division protein FtsI (penicillin-binding protein 3)
MRDVNHLTRSRSHHRQRAVPTDRHGSTTRPVPPTRSDQGRISAKHERLLTTPSTRRRTPTAGSAGRAAGQQRGRVEPRGRAGQQRRRAQLTSQRNAQAFRKRAVAQRQTRIYRAGQSSRRLVAVFVIAAVLFLAVLARVTMLQTVQADALRQAGKSQRTTEQRLKAHRGTIFDREGADLALSVPARTITANPKLVLDPIGTVRTLTALLKLSPEKQQSLTEAFTLKKNSFVYVARQIDTQLAQTIASLGLAGVSAISEDKRILPSGDVGRSVIGRTDPDLEGTGGLEQEYNDILRGVDGEQSQEHDRKFRSIAGGDETVAPIPGSDMVLTLDRGLQYQVERAVLARVEQLKAVGGTAIVMGVHTGDVYASANVRRAADGTPEITSANLAATDAHEPGSVAKVFSLSAAVNEGLATPETTISVPGFLVYKPVNKSDEKWKFKIRDAEPHNEKQMSLRDIIVHSSNIGTVLITEGLGTLKFGDYLHQFGFGSTTGLGLPGESSGIMKPAADWQATEKVTPRYGYGYAATSLQLAAAVNTIANGGVYVAPRLVLSTIDANGQTHVAPPSPSHTVVTPETANTMTSMMTDVVCYGTAKYAKVPGMSVAGKTGTALLKPTGDSAQTSSSTADPVPSAANPTGDANLPANTDYQAEDGTKEYYSTFVGYFPADNPQVTILVSIDRPDPSSQDHLGGKAAGPLFSTLATIAMHELKVSPSPNDNGCQDSAG